MQPYQERVVAEKKELDEKIAKLREFIDRSDTRFRALEIAERYRLQDQYAIMQRYSQVLADRIAAF